MGRTTPSSPSTAGVAAAVRLVPFAAVSDRAPVSSIVPVQDPISMDVSS
jgi:hypothetical protein